MKKQTKRLASALLVLLLTVSLCACSLNQLGWSDAILGDMLPTPPSEYGRITVNTKTELRAEVEEISPKQSVQYVEDCKALGFTVDPVEEDMDYTAYNADGFKLFIDYVSYNEDMWIELCAPMEMEQIVWTDSQLRSLLPAPKSTQAMIETEYSTSFTIYMGETSAEDYAEYVALCIEAGYAEEIDQSQRKFTAKNADEVKVTVKYEGNNIMSIYLSAYGKNETATETPAETQTQTEEKETTKATEKTSTGIRPEFKAAMDSYEDFMDDYVEFMKKVEKNPNDPKLLMSYAQYLADYAEFCEDFAAWESGEMNAAEQKYYIEVQTRVNKKLLEVAS